MTKAKVKVDKEWAVISKAYCEAQVATADAFAALEKFDSKAPSKGGQKAYNKWRDANEEARYELERATLIAARSYVMAEAVQDQYLDDMGV
jgi:hypothetical protein